MARANYSTMGWARSAIRTVAAHVGRILAPVHNRIGRRATWIYAILITSIVAFNILAFVNQEQVSRLAADFRSWSENQTPAGAILPAAPGPEPTIDTRPLNIFSPPQPPFFQLATHLSFEPPYFVTRADTLRHNQTIIHLAFIEGIAPNEICLNEYLARFPCGLMGRASIQNLISRQEVVCRPIFYWHDDIRYHCFMNETDISLHQVGAGFAKPDFLRLVEDADAMKAAKVDGTGAWNGGWTLIDSEEVLRKDTLYRKLDVYKESINAVELQKIHSEKNDIDNVD